METDLKKKRIQKYFEKIANKRQVQYNEFVRKQWLLFRFGGGKKGGDGKKKNVVIKLQGSGMNLSQPGFKRAAGADNKSRQAKAATRGR